MLSAFERLDLRLTPPASCVSALLSRFDRLRPHGQLFLVTQESPAPVLRLLQAQRPRLFDCISVGGADGGFTVLVRRRLRARDCVAPSHAP